MDADLKEQLAAQWKNQFKVVLQLSSLAAVKEHYKNPKDAAFTLDEAASLWKEIDSYR